MAHAMDPARFWSATPREIQVCLRGAQERLYRELRQSQAIAFSQAMLVIRGWHDPKTLPPFTKAFPDPRAPARVEQSPQDMLAALRRWSAGQNRRPS